MADTISSRGSTVARLTHKAKRLDVKTPFFETAKCNNHPNPDWFFEIQAGHGVEQKKYCTDCPVINQCLDYALNVRVLGVWGGTTPEERNKLREEYNINPIILTFGQPDTFGERFHPNARRRRNTEND